MRLIIIYRQYLFPIPKQCNVISFMSYLQKYPNTQCLKEIRFVDKTTTFNLTLSALPNGQSYLWLL